MQNAPRGASNLLPWQSNDITLYLSGNIFFVVEDTLVIRTWPSIQSELISIGLY